MGPGPDPVMSHYTTPDDVRAYLGIVPSQLSDEDADRVIRRAQTDIDAACGGWLAFPDTGLKFASDDRPSPLTDDQKKFLNRATCMQVEYRLVMGDDFMIRDQYESSSGSDGGVTGTIRKVSDHAYSELHKGGLLRLWGKAASRYVGSDLPRA